MKVVWNFVNCRSLRGTGNGDSLDLNHLHTHLLNSVTDINDMQYTCAIWYIVVR